MKSWQEECNEKIRQQAAEFTAQQIAAGRIKADSVSAMSASDIRLGLTARPQAVEPSEQERKAAESAEREQGLRFNHAMAKPASRLDASDRQTLRDSITSWLRENGR